MQLEMKLIDEEREKNLPQGYVSTDYKNTKTDSLALVASEMLLRRLDTIAEETGLNRDLVVEEALWQFVHMKKCPHCGMMNPQDARYCGGCGEPYSPSPKEKVLRHYCIPASAVLTVQQQGRKRDGVVSYSGYPYEDGVTFVFGKGYSNVLHLFAEGCGVCEAEMLGKVLFLFLFGGVCSRCGSQLLRSSHFCPMCGQEVGKKETADENGGSR